MKNVTCLELLLGSNKIREFGVMSLSYALRSLENLTSLSLELSRNSIGEKGI